MRNGYHIIDAHTHIYPDKIAQKAAENIGKFYDGLFHCGGSAGALLELMDQQGIDLSVVNSAAMTPHQVESINHFLFESSEAHPDRFVPLGTMHPDRSPGEQERDVHFLLDHHMHGIKIHPDMLQIPLDDPRLRHIYSLCEEAGLPVLLHTGDSRYDFTNLNRLEPVVRDFPRLTIVGGHFAGREFYREAADRLHGYPNLYADCSSSFAWLSKEDALYCLRTYTADRIMFGTDHPVFRPGFDLDYLFSLPLTHEELEKILSRTAQKVYGFTAPWEKGASDPAATS